MLFMTTLVADHIFWSSDTLQSRNGPMTKVGYSDLCRLKYSHITYYKHIILKKKNSRNGPMTKVGSSDFVC